MHTSSCSGSPHVHMPLVRLFTWRVRLWWMALFVMLLLSELLPRPNFGPLLYYSYSGAKALMFLLMGFLTPLTFWRFDRLGLGVIFSIFGAGVAEMSQSTLAGHRSSFLEFLLKLILLVTGFGLGLSVRYDRKLSVGRFGIRFTDSHLKSAD